jgi:hypothetical protein
MCFPLTFESEEIRRIYETLAARVAADLSKNRLTNPVAQPSRERAEVNA